MQDQKVNIDRLTALFRAWDTKLQSLEAKAAAAGADEKAGLQQQINELRQKRQETQQELDKLQKAACELDKSGQPTCCAPGDISGVCQIKDN